MLRIETPHGSEQKVSASERLNYDQRQQIAGWSRWSASGLPVGRTILSAFGSRGHSGDESREYQGFLDAVFFTMAKTRAGPPEPVSILIGVTNTKKSRRGSLPSCATFSMAYRPAPFTA